MINVEFDFASDSPGYWDRFWENNDGLGGGGSDPDSVSVVLQRYSDPTDGGRIFGVFGEGSGVCGEEG